MRLRRGARVVELGCWPGAWLQVLAGRVGPDGVVVGVDVKAVDPLGPPVTTLAGDFTDAAIRERIAAALGGPADLIASDAAPGLSGIADVDRAAMEELHEGALALVEELAAPDAAVIIKAFPGAEAQAMRARIKARFGKVAEVRPEGKRATSREFYWVAGPGPSSGGSRSRGRGRGRSRKR